MMRIRGALLTLLIVTVAACGTEQGSPPPTPEDSTPTTSVPRVVAPSAGVTRSEPSPDAPVDELVVGFNDAGLQLLRQQPEADNVVMSPTSIAHALLMARGAADDPTALAIDDLFSLPGGLPADQAWNTVDHELRAAADRTDEVTVQLADRIWPRLDVEPNQAWIDVLAAEHGSDVLPLDMAGDPDGSREVINQWVADQTNDLITDLMPLNSIRSDPVLVLTDAIYLAEFLFRGGARGRRASSGA